MKGTLLIALSVTCVFGCSGKTDVLTDSEKNAMTVKSPDVTAEQSQKELANSDLSPEVKKVLGGGQRGN